MHTNEGARDETREATSGFPFLDGGGEMGARTRAFDWSRTSVGSVEQWPQSLKTAVSIMLGCEYPLLIWWGEELIHFYNDAYIPVLGQRHPSALGSPAPVVWSEAWPVVGPQADAVMDHGRSYWNEELLIVMTRNGYPEEVYMTFSYGPIRDDDGGIGGVFCACTEETRRVIDRRQLRTLRALADQSSQSKTAEEACRIAAATLGENPHDLPFALLYLLDSDGSTARLAGGTGLAADSPAAPAIVDLDAPNAPWPFLDVLRTTHSVDCGALTEHFGPLPGGPWPEPTNVAVIKPMLRPGQGKLAGFVVAGISPRLPLDDGYRGFLALVAGQVATAVANARAYEEERQRAEALAELDRVKTAFFSNVSHEFRTPLTLMLGPLEDILHDGRALPNDTRERLDVAHRNSQRLLRLVDTLLDFSRIEAGRIDAVYEPTDLGAFTTELASVFRAAVERAGLRLVVNSPPLEEPVWVDREMWEKIVLNLLSNAFKFTFAGEIEVSLSAEHDGVRLVVRDTGTGIPPNELTRVFERFHRVNDAHGRTFEGSGIGLALVQEMVRLHGGTVHVTSEVGRGSTFVVTIPLGNAHLPADRLDATRTRASTGARGAAYVAEVLRWLPATSDLVRDTVDLPPAPRRPADTNGTAARILVVDNNADMREYLTRLLNDRYVTDAAGDGLEALAIARMRRPDLVLADVMMPPRDGFGLLATMRSDSELRTVPIIMLSARAGEEARVEGMEAGADDYLVKPFSARELLARVDGALQLERVRRDSARMLRDSEARQAFLVRLGDALRPVADPAEVQATAARLLGEHLGVSRAFYHAAESSPHGLVHVVKAEFVKAPAMPSLIGRRPQATFGSNVFAQLKLGATVAVPDVAALTIITPEERARHLAINILSYVAVPLVKRGEFVAGFAIAHSAPRHWSPQEVALIEETAERTWSAVEQARAQAGLRKSEERYRTLFETIDEGFCVIEVMLGDHGQVTDLIFRDVNDAFERQTGVTGVVGRTVADVLPTFEHYWIDAYARVVQTGEPDRTENYVQDVGRWYRADYSQIGGPGSRLIAVVFEDISERKRAEHNQTLLSNVSKALVALVNVTDTMTRLAARVGAYFGVRECTISQLTETGAVEAAYRWSSVGAPAIDATYLTTRLIEGNRLSSRRRGSAIVVRDTHSNAQGRADAQSEHYDIRSFIAVPMMQAGIKRFQLSLVDRRAREWRDDEIALARELAARIWTRLQRAHAEHALRASEARLQSMVNVSGVGVLLFDIATGALIDANEAFLTMTGYTRRQVEKRELTWRMLTPPEHIGVSEAEMIHLTETGRIGPYEKEYNHSDGTRSWMLFAGAALGDGTVAEYCVDITDRKRAEAALREVEQRFQVALSTANMAYWDWNPATGTTIGSASTADVFGLLPGQTYDSTEFVFRLIHPDDRDAHRALVQAAAAQGEGWHSEFRIVRPRDGVVAWLEERATVTWDAISGEMHRTGFVWDITDRKRVEAAAERERLERDRSALRRRLLQAEEDERRRLARELHDEVGQHLTALSLGLRALSNAAPPSSDLDQQAAELGAVVSRMGQDLHGLAVRLRPKALDDFGLEAAITGHAEEWSRRSGIAVDVHARVDAERLTDAVESAVYRIVQEALTNVARHSGATRAGVVVERRDGHVVAIVEDDGHGFDAGSGGSERATSDGGLGLLGIRERVVLLGGTVDIESSQEQGTTLYVRIPVDASTDLPAPRHGRLHGDADG